MSAKEVKFSQEAREKMIRRIDVLANVVRVTLGPKGRKTSFSTRASARRASPRTVAKEVELADKFENMGRGSATPAALPCRSSCATAASISPSSRRFPPQLTRRGVSLPAVLRGSRKRPFANASLSSPALASDQSVIWMHLRITNMGARSVI